LFLPGKLRKAPRMVKRRRLSGSGGW
jgi:hypothetical protein